MKHTLLVAISLIIGLSVKATDQDSTINFHLPDSVKAVQFMADITVTGIPVKKEAWAGIKSDAVSLSLETDSKHREIEFSFPASATPVASGIGTETEKEEISLDYNWAEQETYKLLLSVATDSAENFSIYSGYAWLPRENKWKLIGSCKIKGRWTTILQPSVFYSAGKKNHMQITTGAAWVQRSGGWYNLKSEKLAAPVVNLYPHLDSLAQAQAETKIIENAISAGLTDTKTAFNGVYYHMMKEGSGRQVALTDTVVAFYKGYLFSDNTVFDQTKDQPATFPLNRLIKGWQVGVPQARVGGRVKLLIPSGMAYSIRTRAAKIPPNSILVFEIEIVDTKPAL